mmetsp:Transcript_12021/g.11902  ORF Transcript_12021/g.11902 Transcript_12021/m.11902 type:complete len:106 (+) Transcript_12021:968-1285(+)
MATASASTGSSLRDSNQTAVMGSPAIGKEERKKHIKAKIDNRKGEKGKEEQSYNLQILDEGLDRQGGGLNASDVMNQGESLVETPLCNTKYLETSEVIPGGITYA